jgi:hypothetical protein
MSDVFTVVKQDGKLRLTAPTRYLALEARLGEGEEREMVIRKPRQRQGSQQLRYLRGVVIPDVANACGYSDPDDYQDVYEGLMWKFCRLPDGKFGEPRRESASHASMSMERLSQVIDQIITYAEAEIVGCRVRRPEEVDLEQVPDYLESAA